MRFIPLLLLLSLLGMGAYSVANPVFVQSAQACQRGC